MGVISSETTISRRPQNVNLSAKRMRTPEEEETRTRREGTKRRLKYVADRKFRKKTVEKRAGKEPETLASGLRAAPSDVKAAGSGTVSVDGKHGRASGFHDIKSRKHIRHVVRKNTKAAGKQEQDIYDTEWAGNRINQDSAEHTGREKGLKSNKQKQGTGKTAGTAGTFLFQFLLFAKAVVAAMTNIIAVTATATVIIVVIAAGTIQETTYGFMADEAAYIRETVSKATMDISNEINEYKQENACDFISVSGELCDWKEVIAFWWTLKMCRQSSGAQDEYISGNDYDDIRLIFSQFNNLSYGVPGEVETSENATGRRMLQVKITNMQLSEMEELWGFDREQTAYIDELLADDVLWEEILDMKQLSRIAHGQTGKSGNQYTEGRTAEENTAFVCWCISQAGGMTEGYIDEEESALNLMYQLNRKGFGKSAGSYEPEEGDIAFLSTQGGTRAGIVTGATDESVYIVLAHYMAQPDVEQIEVTKDAGQIRSYAHISGFYIEAICGAKAGNLILSGSGSLLWPVGGEYYTVTSKYGPRDMFGRSFHYGMDIACPVGTPIVACMDGTVAAAGYNASMGNYITLTHADGMQTTYMHNSQLIAAPGEQVAAGSIIALSGNTGQSTGPHCHLSVKINGENTDPAPYLGLPEGFEGDAGEYIK